MILTMLLVACAGLSEHQRIAVACDAEASSLQALTAAERAGRISKAQLGQAIDIYKRTVPVCEPPAQSLDAVQKAALDLAVAELAARVEKSK
jgi:hypothetical protein